jgi:NADH-quinone oxidoreductase subunit J
MTITPETILFFILATVSIVAALLMVTAQNPVRSALYLVLTFLCVAVFYVTLNAQFIAAVQIIVYAGAIMVLFLFVIMLLNLGAPQAMQEKGRLQGWAALVLGIAFAAALGSSGSLVSLPRPNPNAAEISASLGTVQGIGANLYNADLPWLFPFEITSVLLLISLVGAIIMAKRKISDV